MLTIAIPTFNRASRLDQQLAWLAAAVAGHEQQVELVVSDNCSTDATTEVTARWRAVLGPELLKVRRQPENVGAIRNIRECLVRARQRHAGVGRTARSAASSCAWSAAATAAGHADVVSAATRRVASQQAHLLQHGGLMGNAARAGQPDRLAGHSAHA